MAENGTNRDELSAPQRRVIGALLTERSVADAAKKTKVAARTIFRWLAGDDAFVTELRKAEGALLDEVTRRLLSMQGNALDALEQLLVKSEDEGVRLRAAQAILGHVLKLREIRDIEDRLTHLEELAENGKAHNRQTPG